MMLLNSEMVKALSGALLSKSAWYTHTYDGTRIGLVECTQRVCHQHCRAVDPTACTKHLPAHLPESSGEQNL